MLGRVVSNNDKLSWQRLAGDYAGATPLGSILAIFSSRCPDGFLPCDGSQFDKLQYPDLYDLLNDDHTPDLREVTLVGVGENDTDEITTHDTYSLGEFKDDQIVAHNHDMTHTHTFSGWTSEMSGATSAGFQIRHLIDSNVNVASEWNDGGRVAVAYHGAGYWNAGLDFAGDVPGNNDGININLSHSHSYSGTTSAASKSNTGNNGDKAVTHGKQKGVYYIIKAIPGMETTDLTDALLLVEKKLGNTIQLKEVSSLPESEDIENYIYHYNDHYYVPYLDENDKTNQYLTGLSNLTDISPAVQYPTELPETPEDLVYYVDGSFFAGNSSEGTYYPLSADAVKYVTSLPSSDIENIIYILGTESTYTKNGPIDSSALSDLYDEDLLIAKNGKYYGGNDVVSIKVEYDDGRRTDSYKYLYLKDTTLYVVLTDDSEYEVEALHFTIGNWASPTYYVGRKADQSVKEMTMGDQIFVGTQAEWNALTANEKNKYKQANITDVTTTLSVTTDEVANGNMNPVTSNAVYQILHTAGLI